MKKSLLTLILGTITVGGSAVTPMWLRDVLISPDGTEIAFCYRGGIYKVLLQVEKRYNLLRRLRTR